MEFIPNDHNLYIEVFGGALNVLYAKELPTHGKYRELINDYNSELINLHKAIREEPILLTKYINQLFISREIFCNIKHKLMKPRDDTERAAFYFYQLQMSFGSKGDNFAMACKSRKPKNIFKDFTKWSDRLKMVTIENMDFEKLIINYDKEDAFLYLDPPYVGTESYYKNDRTFSLDDHKRLHKLLLQVKGRFLLSYNDCEIVRQMYKDFKIVESNKFDYTLGSNVHGKKKTVSELFIMNY